MADPRYSKTQPVPPPTPILLRSAEDDVFGGYAGLERSIHADFEGFRLALEEALGREHVLDFARADAECQRAECAVRGGVAIAADYRHAGLGEA